MPAGPHGESCSGIRVEREAPAGDAASGVPAEELPGRPGTVPSGPPLEPRPAFPLTTAAAAPAGSTPRAGRDRAFPAFLLGVDILPWQAVPAVWTSSALRRYGIRRGGRRRGGMRCDTLRRIPRWGLLVRLCLRRSTLLRAVSAGVGIGASGCLTKMGPSAAPGTTGPGASGTAGRRMGRPAAAGSSGGLPNGL